MKKRLGFDCALWGGMLDNAESYCLSAVSGISPVCDLELSDDLLVDVGSSFLIKTSGSTGTPKWVVHSKQSILRHAGLVNEYLDVSIDDVFGLVIPSYHVGGLGVIARAHVSGARLAAYTDRWSASSCVDFLVENEVSVLSLVPTQLVDIIQDVQQCPVSVRVVVIGGGRLESEIRYRAKELGWPIEESYGMTETGSQIATGFVSGLAESHYLKLIDGWLVRLSGAGVLEVKGECLFRGYLVGELGNFEFINPKINGWFTTSDLAELLDVDGNTGVRFLGRSDQQVKILGELVDVYDLENKLKEILEYEVFIITLPDERRGVKLFPVIKDELLITSILDLGWTGLRRLEAPVLVPAFPRNAMGKLQRAKLAEVVESIVFSAD